MTDINATWGGIKRWFRANGDAGATYSEVVTSAEQTYSTPATGELQGSASAIQMPSVACHLCRFKAVASNVGKVYIGTSTNVTKVDGTTDTTSGFELAAGDDTGWLPVTNTNVFWRICDNAGDDLTYLCL